MTELSQAGKALAAASALNMLKTEYVHHPLLVKAVDNFMADVTPPQLALLFELVHSTGCKQEALDILSGALPATAIGVNL